MSLKGRIVLALSGHDKGLYFLVVEDDGRYLCLADGKTRKLEKPKKKKRKHAFPVGSSIMEDICGLTNKKLKAYIRSVLAYERIIN